MEVNIEIVDSNIYNFVSIGEVGYIVDNVWGSNFDKEFNFCEDLVVDFK